MGAGTYTSSSFAAYSNSRGKSYDASTGRITSGQSFTADRMKKVLNPKGVIRECVNTDEHPNTVPVIIGLDVTGSMGDACQECAETLGTIMKTLYDRFKDVEVMVMGIGDFEYDDAPLQVSQFESDVRIAEQLDNIYMEQGGGGNNYESYSAAWYFGLYKTKLDAFDKQGRKGIIITMGDEPLNPDLPVARLKDYLGESQPGTVDTQKLYAEASKKFDIYHLFIEHGWRNAEEGGGELWGKLLGQNYIKNVHVPELSKTIVDCISKSIENTSSNVLTEDSSSGNEISW